MAGVQARRGDLRLILLAMLSDGPQSGSNLVHRLRAESEGRYLPSAGSIWPRLSSFYVHGFVNKTGTSRNVRYELTDLGRAELRAAGEGALDEARRRLLGASSDG